MSVMQHVIITILLLVGIAAFTYFVYLGCSFALDIALDRFWQTVGNRLNKLYDEAVETRADVEEIKLLVKELKENRR